VSQFQNSLEFLLKIRAEGQQVLDQVSAQIDQFANAQAKTGAANIGAAASSKESAGATGELVEAQKQATQALAASNSEVALQRGALSGLAAQVRTAAAAYIGLAGARRAITLANAQEQAEQRLLGLLQAQLASRDRAIAQQIELLDLAQRLQREIGLFGDEEFLGAASQLIAVSGRTDLDFERLLRVSADAAVALYQGNLDTAVRNIARTFGGQAGEVGEVIPELAAIRRELAPAQFTRQLREGLVVDLLERRFSGVAQATADSATGANRALRNAFFDELETLGSALLPAVNFGLARLIEVVTPFTRAVGVVSGTVRGDREAVRDSGERLIDAQVESGAFLLRLLGLGDTARLAQAARRGDSVSISPQPGDPDYERFLQLKRETEEALERLRQETRDAAAADLTDFDAETRRALIIQLGLVDELNVALLETEDSFKRLGALDEFPLRLFEGDALRESELLFNIAKIGITQEQGLRDLAEAQTEYNNAVRRANDLVEAGQLSEARRNEIIGEAREKLRGLIGDTEELAEVSRSEIREAIEGLQNLVDAEGNLAITIDLDAETQITSELDKAIQSAKDRLTEGADDIGALSAEFGQRAFGPLVSELDDVFKTGEASFTGFATAILDTATRLFSEIVIGDFLALLLGGTRQNIGVGGGGFLGGAFNFLGGLLGFDQGGQIPGPDVGRDSRIVAVRGHEFVVRPEPLRFPGVLAHVDAINRGDFSSIDFAKVRGMSFGLPPTLSAIEARDIGSIPGYASGGFVDAFASVAPGGGGGGGGNAADAIFGPTRASRGGDVTIVPVLPVTRRTAEEIIGGRAGRDTTTRIAREATGASTSGAPGARGMRS
jgi:hypothetical protein